MFSYTIEDYLRLERIFFAGKKFKVSDVDSDYHYEVNEKHHKHDKIIRNILNNKEEVVKIINRYVKPEDKLRKEEMKEIREKLKNEERDDIMHVHEVLRRDREKYAQEAKKEGIKEGIMKKAILDAKKMLEENLDVNLIMRITGLKKEQFMK